MPLSSCSAKTSTASLSVVAETAGVGRTTLHRYFPTRELLIRALVEDALDRVAEAIASAHPDEGPVLDALQRVTDTVVPLGPSLSFLHAEPEVYNARDLIRRWYEALEPVSMRSSAARPTAHSATTCPSSGSSTPTPERSSPPGTPPTRAGSGCRTPRGSS